MSKKGDIHPFSAILKAWYKTNKRDLPWRDTTDPYLIWLSEIILQQTRVEQGKPYYYAFVEKYPDVNALANAPQEQVLKTWEGLGYYSRARNLHATAKIVAGNLKGNFPKKYDELIQLKGIGPYTAAAISSFAANEARPVVDGNVFRVLARVFGIDADIADGKNRKLFEETAAALLPPTQPGLHNQAIMEFGALQCSPKPRCESCLARYMCVAYAEGKQESLPVKLKKTAVKTLYFYYLVIRKKEKIYMKERKAGDIWQGLYDFPLISSETELTDKKVAEQARKICGDHTIGRVSKQYKHLLSHRKLMATFIEIDDVGAIADKELQLFDKEQITKLPKPILIINYLKDYIF